ncbi:hypothetical protein A2954_00830 [Candidatus Roizmanbacteria bacterium RIFCSPLOWO2_01_FULL_37_12]|uniref:Uncharacterized protein n=1 Tax=Candidatus Roizmanbacteria bacterium RIFCSPLOWO2_01_FULL_37_12 TaxID=1802056 RepID=A0A1F7IDU5_9BACT|nr:MAG: hypothetical protein A3D76_01005 [Candidatus Roizmanbacteria bacterium RIFCSPHIGHO2_02_FULL_37_9b]OGK41531.1 MAG: hypothetical protein A2954_00830 [Candidatus Roizmanbacteria bacterium RIFCSPLOWO2_01_FULL_37_12]
MAKSKAKLQARELRQKGKSIKEIAEILKVSPGSVSVWCRDIELTTHQIEVLQERMLDVNYGNRVKYLQRVKDSLNKKIKELKNEGIKEIGKLSKREIFLIGVTLYWGEGFKKDHLVGFATSDMSMAKFFLYWLKESFQITSKSLIFRVTANISYQNKINDLVAYWSKELNIQPFQFSQPYFQKTVWKKEYENKDQYHGVIRIKVRKSINLLRKIYGFIEGISLNLK